MPTLKDLVDETTNIKNELIKCHFDLKSNLIDKGITVENTDKMKDLIDKVSLLLNSSKKWAKGSLSGTSATFTIPNIGFIPSILIVYSIKPYDTATTNSYIAINVFVNKSYHGKNTKYIGGSMTSTQSGLVSVRNEGLTIDGNNNITIQYSHGWCNQYDNQWIAFE